MDEVCTVADKAWIGLLLDNNEKVAIYATLTRSIALARYGNHHTLGNTCRDIELYNLAALDITLARALAALVLNHSTLTATNWARTLRLHTTEECVLHLHNIARTVTVRAGYASRAILCAATVTSLASDILVELQLLCYSICNLLECKAYANTNIRATANLRTASAATTTAKAKSTTEDIAKLREDILHRESTTKATVKSATASSATHTCVTKLVIASTLVGIREHIVCLCSLLKLLLGLFIIWVAVWVILERSLSIRLLYLIGIGVFLDAKHLVVISLFCHNLLSYNNFSKT